MKLFLRPALVTLFSGLFVLSSCSPSHGSAEAPVVDKVAGKVEVDQNPVAKLTEGTIADKRTMVYDGGKVVQVVAKLMEQCHISQKPFDETINQIFLKHYYDALDPSHMVFLQKDIDDFNAKYLSSLNDLCRRGEIAPAKEIHDRFVARMEEWKPYLEGLLKEKIDFTLDESFVIDRRKLPWPTDELEARELWRKRIKFEILETRLTAYDATKHPSLGKADAANTQKSTVTKPEDSPESIARRYARRLKDFKDEENIDVATRYLTALTVSFDPHSEYQDPTEARNFEISTIKLELAGIGAVLKYEDGYAKIVSLVPGGPADLNNLLKPDDRIIAVKQEKGEAVNVVDMRLPKVVDMIRGERGTKVTLTVLPAAAKDALPKQITIVRDQVKLQDQRAKAKIYEQQLPDGGVERLGQLILEPGFYDNTTEKYSAASDTAKLVKRMEQEKVSGIIIDIRRNGGGLLDQAIQFASLFIKSGPVVQVKGSNGRIQSFGISDSRQIYDGPLLVMTSRLSASAAEIVAAALQDYGRALIVGDKSTHGKGTVQTLLHLKEFMGAGIDWDPGQLKITVQKFYRVNGTSTQLHGVEPDIVLPSIYDYLDDYGEAALPNALPGDEIPPAHYTKVSAGGGVETSLDTASAERLRTDKDFIYLEEAIELQKKRNLDKSISLCEVKRRTEIDQIEDRKKFIHDERASRKPSTEKIYSLDPDLVDARKPLKLVSGDSAGGADKENSSDLSGNENRDANDNVDMHLVETLRILHDYINLTKRGQGSVVATQIKPVVNQFH